MLDLLLPVLFALFLWWFSTGVILYLNKLPTRTYRWSMLGASLVLAASLYGLWVSSTQPTVNAAYSAFTCALLVWAWLEMSYFMGFITGPRKAPCPAACPNRRRFVLAIRASLYHELSIILISALVVALTWGAPNQVGTWTLLILWWMRWSAKLNLFLGVPNLNEEFLPEHLQFLKTYVAKRPMNVLFPISVTVSTIAAALLVMAALQPGATPFEIAGQVLLASLLALAVIEHWFLVLPLPDAALWSWVLRSESPRAPVAVRSLRGSSGTLR